MFEKDMLIVSIILVYFKTQYDILNRKYTWLWNIKDGKNIGGMVSLVLG